MSGRITLTCEELHQLYVVEGLSQAQIAMRLGCSAATVGNRLRRCGIAARAGRFQPRPPPQALLERLYSDEGLPLPLIAAQLGVSVGSVHNWRRAYGIATRARRGPPPPAKDAARRTDRDRPPEREGA